MSAHFYPVPPRAFPIAIGDTTFYVTAWKLTGSRNYAEQSGVSGSGFVTNFGRRARRLEMEGRFYFRGQLAKMLLSLDTAIQENQRFVLDIHGIRYVAVSLVSYTAEESAEEGVLPCRMTWVVQGNMTETPAETEETS